MPTALQLWRDGGTVDGEETHKDDRPLRSELLSRARNFGDVHTLWGNDSNYKPVPTLVRACGVDLKRHAEVTVAHDRRIAECGR